MNNFSKNLRYLRIKKGFAQEKMESLIGIKRATWSNYENGKTNPTIKDIITFSKFFGITLDDLILTDLNALDPLPQKIKRAPKTKRKHVLYIPNESVSSVAENEIKYVIDELKKMREEINILKAGQDSQKE